MNMKAAIIVLMLDREIRTLEDERDIADAVEDRLAGRLAGLRTARAIVAGALGINPDPWERDARTLSQLSGVALLTGLPVPQPVKGHD